MQKNIFKKLNYRKIAIEAVLLLAAVMLGWQFHWHADSLVFFLLFLVLILHPVPSRYPAGGAIAFLLATAFLVVFKKNELAEMMAIWAYYAMIFTLFMSLYELRRSSSEKGD